MLAAFLLSLLSAGSPAAPGPLPDRWLEVDPFRSNAQPVTTVSLFEGVPPVVPPVLLSHHKQQDLGRLELRVTKGSDGMLDQLIDDGPSIVRLDMSRLGLGDGTYLVTLDERPTTVQLTAEQFQAYLRTTGFPEIAALRVKQGHGNAPGEMRHSRYMKSIFQRGNQPDDFVTMPVAQDLEIVTLKNPYGLRPGASVQILLLYRGQPLVGRKVTAVNLLEGKMAEKAATTDSLGRASFALDGSGDWLLRAVYIEPSKEPDVDWRSFGASLTFSITK